MDVYDYFIITGFVFIFIFGVVGNILVIYVFKNLKDHHTRKMNMLISYLAAFDLLSSVLNPALFIYWQITSYKEWMFGRVGCKLLSGFQKISVTASFGMVLLITLERTLTITKNMRIPKVKLRVAVLVVFICSILFETNYLINLDLHSSEIELKFTCRPDHFSLKAKSGFQRPGITKIVDNSKNKNLRSATFNVLFVSLYECHDIRRKDANITDAMDDHSFYTFKNNIGFMNNQSIRTILKENSYVCKRSCKTLSVGCSSQVIHSLHVDVIVFLIRILLAFSVLFICNCCIYKTLYNTDTARIMVDQEYAIKPNSVFRMLVVMASVFVVLVLPKDVFIVIYSFLWMNGRIVDYNIALKINAFLALLQTSNCVCNIFIYARLNKRFKQNLTSRKDSVSTIPVLIARLSQWKYRSRSRTSTSVKYHHCMYCEKYYPYCERESKL